MVNDKFFISENTIDLNGILFIPTKFEKDFGNMIKQLESAVFDEDALPPTKLFDNLYYIGTRFVGVMILDTESGLVMIDSMSDESDYERIILPGMKELGLDPNRLTHIIISHGHFDHYGSAKWIKEKHGCKVLMSKVDHELLLNTPSPPGRGKSGAEADPGVDEYIDGNSVLDFGDNKMYIVDTPGHTPGGVSFVFTAKDGNAKYNVGTWGGTMYPFTKEETEVYISSVDHFIEICQKHHVEVSAQIHPCVDYSLFKGYYNGKLDERKKDETHPMVMGEKRFKIFLEALKYGAIGHLEMLDKQI